jgi:hypothetical protein
MSEYFMVTFAIGFFCSLVTIIFSANRSTAFYIKTIVVSTLLGPVIPILAYMGMPNAIQQTLKD